MAFQRDKINHCKTSWANLGPPLTHTPQKPEGHVSHPQRRHSVKPDTPDVCLCWTLDVFSTKSKWSDSRQMFSWIHNPAESGLGDALLTSAFEEEPMSWAVQWGVHWAMGLQGQPLGSVCSRASGGPTLRAKSPARGRPDSSGRGSGHVCPEAALGPGLQPVVLPPISPPSLLHNIRWHCWVQTPLNNNRKYPHTCQTAPSRTAPWLPYSTETPWKPYKMLSSKTVSLHHFLRVYLEGFTEL